MKNKAYKWVKHIIKSNIMSNNNASRQVVIGKQYIDSGLFLISPLSDFIFQFSHKKITTQISYADVVVQFLNYVSTRQNLEINNLTEQDAIDFLNSCDANSTTKNTYANKLEKFYLFLIERKMLSNNVFVSFKGKYNSNSNKQTMDVIHSIKNEYLPLFISTAIEDVPEIALGVFLGCFGGLRNSEIVSIEYDDISYQYNQNALVSIIINLHDKDLRPELEYAFLSKVKKNRKQEIIPAFGDLLQRLLDKQERVYKSEKTNALFVDEKGLPMTAKTYSKKFGKLKRHFIKRLEQSDSFEAQTYAMYLQSYNWSTHICRGIFSNIVASTTNNIGEIALWRGDSSMTSALTYLNNKEQVGEDVQTIMNHLLKGDALDG